MTQESNTPNNSSLTAILQKQVMEIANALQAEIKRLCAQPNESSGNVALYRSLADKALKIKAEAFNLDMISALDIVVQELEQALGHAKDRCQNRDLLPHLELANSELSKATNIKG